MSQQDNTSGTPEATPSPQFETQAAYEKWVENPDKALDNTGTEVQNDHADRLNAGEDGDSANPDDHDDLDADASVDQNGKKRKGGYQRSIDRATRQKREAEAQAEYWRNQTLMLQQQQLSGQKPVEQQAPAKPAVDPNEPDIANFDNTADYIKAVTDYRLQKHQEHVANEQTRAELRVQAQQLTQAWSDKLVAAQERYEDFDEVGEQLVGVDVPKHIQAALLLSDVGPDIAYHVLKSPELQQQLIAAPQGRQIMILGQVEAQILANLRGQGGSNAQQSPSQQHTPDVPVSRAPPPIRPTKGNAARVEKDPSKMTQKEYNEYMDSLERKSRS